MTTTSPFRLARRAAKMNPSVIREILKLTEKPGVISFAGGLPLPKTFPVEAMREATERVLRDTPHEVPEAMLAALDRHMPARVRWNRPAAGMFLWVELPIAMSAVELLPLGEAIRAARENLQ